MNNFTRIVKYTLMIGLILIGLGLLMGYRGQEGLIQSQDDFTYETKPLNQDINSIKVDMNLPNLHIKAGQGDQATITYPTDKKSQKYKITWQEDNGQLNIESQSKKVTFFNFLKPIAHPTVTVELPQGTELDSLDLKLGTGEANLSGINCQAASINLNLGDLSISDSVFDNILVQVDTGELTLSKLTSKLSASLAVSTGSIKGDWLAMGESEISSNLGDIQLRLPNKDKLDLDLKTDLGTIEAGDNKSGGELSIKALQQSEGKLKITNNTGDIILK